MNKLSNGRCHYKTTADYRARTNIQTRMSERKYGSHGRPPIEQSFIPPRKLELEDALNKIGAEQDEINEILLQKKREEKKKEERHKKKKNKLEEWNRLLTLYSTPV